MRKKAVKGKRVIWSLWKDYEIKECIYEAKERVKEQYSLANIDVWIRDLDME